MSESDIDVTAGCVPETKYQMALDAVRKARTDASRWERIARDHQSACKSLKETNADLLQIIDKTKAENTKLRELMRDYHTFLALAELAQPIGSVIAAHGHPTLSVKALDKRYRELGIEVSE